MYEVRIETRFSAQHHIKLHDGTLEASHNHDWKVQAVFRGPKLDRLGILVDFDAASDALRQTTGIFDKKNINNLPLMADSNPTAENVAHKIFHLLKQKLGKNTPLNAVYMTEAPGCTAGYIEPIL